MICYFSFPYKKFFKNKERGDFLGNLQIKDPPIFTEQVHQIEEEEYLTAELENEIKGALLNNEVFLKVLAETIQKTVEAHIKNGNLHVTEQDKNIWSSKATVDHLHDERYYTKAEISENISNPNLLINPDFRNPINQRGQTGYHIAGYAIDRWYKGDGSVYIKDGYLELYRTGHVNSLSQFVELDAAEQILTFSVCTTENKIYNNTQYIKNIDKTYDYTEIEKYKMRMSYDSNRKLLKTEIYCDGNDDSAILGLKWAKLELGSSPTHFTPPDLTEELLKCQRYYYSLDFSIYSEIQQYGFRLPVKMRGNPTTDFNSSNKNIVIYSTNDTSVVLASMSSGAWIFNTNGYEYLRLDAEIY